MTIDYRKEKKKHYMTLHTEQLKNVSCKQKTSRKGVTEMRGFFTSNGFCGLVDGVYRLFASEQDYYEFCAASED